MTRNPDANLEAAKEKFELFIFEMDDAIDELKKDIASINQPDFLPLDETFASLDRVERWYGLVLDGHVRCAVDADILATRIMRYVGETLRREVGGKWDFAKARRDINFGQPCITNIPGLPKSFQFFPLTVVGEYQRGRRAGWIREKTQRYDVAYIRAEFARFRENREEDLAALNSYVFSLERPELLPLDFSLETLDRLEHLLVLALEGKVAPPVQGIDWLTKQIARFMAEIYRQQVGGDWELCEDPRDIDFALPRIDSFSPLQIVGNFLVHRPDGLLRRTTENRIKLALERSGREAT